MESVGQNSICSPRRSEPAASLRPDVAGHGLRVPRPQVLPAYHRAVAQALGSSGQALCHQWLFYSAGTSPKWTAGGFPPVVLAPPPEPQNWERQDWRRWAVCRRAVSREEEPSRVLC